MIHREWPKSPQQNVLCTGRGDEFDKSISKQKKDYQFATNCPHHFTIDYGRLRAGISSSKAGITFRTVTDDPFKDGSQVNGRELYQDGLEFAGVATYPIVSRVDVSRVEDNLSVRYFLVNDYTLTGAGGSLTVLGVVRPRVVLTQGVTAVEVTDALKGDMVAGGGGWYEVRVPLATVAEQLGVSAGELTNVVATVATVPEGTRSIPWVVGTGVTAIGEHAFDGIAANVPVALTEDQVPRCAGAVLPPGVDALAIVDGKAYLGVSVCTNSEVKAKGEGVGWGVATNDVIVVPAPCKQGFFYLMSKPAAPYK